MEEVIRKTVNEKTGDKNVTFRKEWKKGGFNFSKEIRQVEGGYIIRENKYGKPEGEENAEWIEESKEYVTTENPFKEKKEEKKEENLFGFIDTPIFNS